MATYKPLIIKSEFRAFCKLGANVPKDDELDTYIRKAQELNFKQTVDVDFYNDLLGSLTSRPELSDFLENYIKPFLISITYEKFLLWHGNNINQYGIRNNIEDTSTQISTTNRAELINDVKSDSNAFLSLMNKQLNDLSYTFDGVIYDFFTDCHHIGHRNLIIKQVGKTKTNYKFKRFRHGY